MAFAVVAPTFGAADPSGAERGRASTLRARDAALAARERAVLLDLYALESKLAQARDGVGALQARSRALAAERALVARRTASVQRSLDAAQSRLGQILRDLYLHGRPDPIAIILGASSIDDALTGLDSFRRADRQNRLLLAQLASAREQLVALSEELARRAADVQTLRVSAESAAATLGSVSSERVRTLRSVRARHDLTRRQLGSLERQARRAAHRSEQIAAAAVPKEETPAAAVETDVSVPAAPVTPPPKRGTYTLVVDAVAYHLPGRTASGLPVGVGIVAVDPAVILLGTKLYIPGYGPGIAADVGSAVKGNIIDLWMPSRAKARAWGRRTVTITVYG
jgi:peptidoglycan DL-endopeptidase CwlO